MASEFEVRAASADEAALLHELLARAFSEVARGYTPLALHSHAGYAQPTFVEMEKRLR